MIEVANLSKRYGDLTAVQDVSFTAAPGEILGFLGPNGAGKTTTLRVITGFLPATSGTVRVCGFDVFEQSAEVRRRIGYYACQKLDRRPKQSKYRLRQPPQF